MHAAWISENGNTGRSGEAGFSFPWWSFSKTIIAACAAQLAARGALDLEATGDAPWSLRQLLQHRAGVPCYGALQAYHRAVARGDAPWSRERLLQEVALKPLFAPDEGWAYSNIGYMLAREYVEGAAGCGIDELAGELYGKPLGLGTMRLAETPEEFAGLPWPEGRSYHPGWVYHGCFMGSAEDAARLVQAICAGGGTGEAHLLGVAIEGRPWTQAGYGLGVMDGRAGAAGRMVGHSGAGPFSCCAIYHFPDLPRPVSVAVCSDGSDEAVPEWEAVRIAMAEVPLGSGPID